MRRAIGWLICFALGLVLSPSAQAEKRVALVIGNSAYQNVPRLDNPANDARLMAETLRSLGFTMVGGGAALDLDKAGFDRAVQDFGNEATGAEVALFYYAGHGMQLLGSNYLVPVSANPTKEADADFQLLNADLVLRQMENAGTKLNIVILDACRNNPFGGRGLRAANGGLAQMQAPEGTLISFATQPGNVAQDGTNGDSPFTLALAETLKRPGLDIFQTFNEVGLAVKASTSGTQQPWVSNSPISGSFYFGGAPAANAPADPALQAWNAIRESDAISVFQDYIAKFGDSFYASLAKAKLAELQKKNEQQRLAVITPPEQSLAPVNPVEPAMIAPAKPTAPRGIGPIELISTVAKGQLSNPYAGNTGAANEGHKKYLASGCNGCHGGGGAGGMCPPLTNNVWVYGQDDDTLFRLIALGTDGLQKDGYGRIGHEAVVGPMPPFGSIIRTDDDLWKIIAWIRSVGPR